MLIKFLGPVSYMNTALFERMHQQFKAGIMHTNRKNLARDLLGDAAEELALCLSGVAPSTLLPSEQHHRHVDMAFYGKPTTVAWTDELEEQVLPAMRQLGIENWHAAPYYKLYSGFYLGGRRISIGSYVRFSAPIGLLLDYEDIWAVTSPDLVEFASDDFPVELIAQIESCAELDIASSTRPFPRQWLKIWLLYQDEFHDILDCQGYTKGAAIWLPAGDLGLRAIELVHVLEHPNYPKLLLHNRWLRRTMKAYHVVQP
jgi:hypothetical protein